MKPTRVPARLLRFTYAATLAGILGCSTYVSTAQAGSSNRSVTSMDKTGRNYNNALAKKLSKAALKAGVTVQPEHTVAVLGDGSVFTGAPVDGIESVPAVQLPDGVDAGFIFLSPPPDTPVPAPIPAGFYKFRVSASSAAVEEAFAATLAGRDPSPDNALVNLLDTSGNVVSTHTAYLQHVKSLDVAPGASRAGNFVDVGLEKVVGGSGSPSSVTIQIWYQSSSGWRVCVKIEIPRLGSA